MKRGCFIKIVVLITIIIASLLYIIQHKLDEWFLEPGKNIITKTMEESWETELRYVKANPEKDSLKSLLKFYINGIHSVDEIKNKHTEELISILDKTFQDSLIDRNELEEISNLIKRLNDERSKKN
jgi:hypothetical protein